MFDEEAATYGISAVTTMLALNVHLDIPWGKETIDHDGNSADLCGHVIKKMGEEGGNTA
jgi:hypothetical protein